MQIKHRRTKKSKLIICISAVSVAIVAVVALVLVFNMGKKVSEENWGIGFNAYGGFFSENGDKRKLKAVNKKDELALDFKTSCDYISVGEKSQGEFVFDFFGVSDITLLADTTVKANNVFLKKGNYGKMTKVKINESDFKAEKYFYSADEKNFILESSYDEDRAKDYYTFEEFVSIKYDYYPVVFSLNSDDSVEGLRYKGSEKSDSLGEIAKLIVNATKGMTVLNDEKTNALTSQSEFPAGTDMRSWVKFTGERLSWEYKQHQKHSVEALADEVLASLSKKEDFIIVKYDKSHTPYPKNVRAVVDNEDYCCNPIFEMRISFKPKESA